MRTVTTLRALLCALFLSVLYLTAPAQVQLGETFSDCQAFAASADGSRIVIAKRVFLGAGEGYEYTIRAYGWTGTEWLQLGDILEVNYGVSSGQQVAISADGNYVALNYSASHDGVILPRPVKVFHWNAAEWEQVGEEIDELSSSLSIAANGTRLAIGHYNATAEIHRQGTAAVYEWDGTAWNRLGARFKGAYVNIRLGDVQLSDDGNYLALRSRGENYASNEQDITAVYQWNGSTWNEMSDDLVGPEFPGRMSFAGNGEVLVSYGKGSINRFERQGDIWQFAAAVEGSSASVSADGDRLLLKAGEMYHWINGQWTSIIPPLVLEDALEEHTKKITDGGHRFVTLGNSDLRVFEALQEGFVYTLPIVCSDGGPVTFAEAVVEPGGTFSGPGVTMGEEPGTLVFDPAIAGIGTHNVEYNLDGNSYATQVTVVEPIVPTFGWTDTLVVTELLLSRISGLGQPSGGTYTDDLGYVSDDGNGFTFSLTTVAPVLHTELTYTTEDSSGCLTSITRPVVLINESPNGGLPTPGQFADVIYGEVAESRFGNSLSLSADGRRLAVGAPLAGLGEVTVYERTEAGWEQMGVKLESRHRWEAFGYGVALSGDGRRLVVGIPRRSEADINGSATTGAIQVYRWNNLNWVSMGNRYAVEDNYAFFEFRGAAVAASYNGLLFAMGAPGSSAAASGSVNVYRDRGTDLYPDDSSELDYVLSESRFGTSLAITPDGSRFIVGAPGHEAGQVRVYDRTEDRRWVQAGQILRGTDDGDGFGQSVSMSYDGQRIVVGAPQNDLSAAAGYVRTYIWNGYEWVPQGTQIDGVEAGESFGAAVAVSGSGERLTVGAPQQGENGGRILHYDWNGTDWVLDEALLYRRGKAGDEFGAALAVCGSCEIVAVGAPGEGGLSNQGYVRIFGDEEAAFQQHPEVLHLLSEPVVTYPEVCPLGGIFSGPGVTDNGDGFSYTFNPVQAGVGTATITYTVEESSLTDTRLVIGMPTGTLSLPDTVTILPLENTITHRIDGSDETKTESLTTTAASSEANSYLGALRIFPNPLQDILYLQGPEIAAVQIVDARGRLVHYREGNVTEMNLRTLPSGIYHCRVRLLDGRWEQRRVVKL